MFLQYSLNITFNENLFQDLKPLYILKMFLILGPFEALILLQTRFL